MGKGYLIDTNVLIDYSANRLTGKGSVFLATVIDDNPKISFINKIELLAFTHISDELIGFVDSSIIYGLNDDILEQTIRIRRDHKLKIPDAIIAATAIVNDLILITRNTDDFKKINLIELLNLFDLN
jgi:predicted nucleic acid-binding protein